MSHSQPLFFIFVFFNRFDSKPMTGFEPWNSGIGSDRSTNCGSTTVARIAKKLFMIPGFVKSRL